MHVDLLAAQAVPPAGRPPHVVVPAADEVPVLLEEPDLGLPAAGVPGHARLHAHAALLGAPADEAAAAEVEAELVLVEERGVVLEGLEGVVAEAPEGQDVLGAC